MNKVIINIFKQGFKIVSKSSAEHKKFLTPDIIIFASDKVLYFSFPKDFHTLKIYSERGNPGLTAP